MTPALFTRTSTRPWSEATSATNLSTSRASATSQPWADAAPPAAATASATARQASRSRDASPTVTPRLASSRATARPIPRLAPVTIPTMYGTIGPLAATGPPGTKRRHERPHTAGPRDRDGVRRTRRGTGSGRLGPRPVPGPVTRAPPLVGQARLLRSAYASTPAPITRPATAPTRPYHHAPKRTARRMPTAVPATRPMAV